VTSKRAVSLLFWAFWMMVRPVLPVSLRECTNTMAWCPARRLSVTCQQTLLLVSEAAIEAGEGSLSWICPGPPNHF